MPAGIRLAWRPVPDGAARRDTAWALVRELIGAEVAIENPCPRCGGPHGPLLVVGAPFRASVSYTGGTAVAAVVPLDRAGAIGIDAEEVSGARRAGLDGVLGPGRPATLRDWTRVEAALKADGRGLRVDPALVDVVPAAGGWTATVPGRHGALIGFDLDGPDGVLVSAALAPASSPPLSAR